jgi:ribosomal protein S18 acetylase RimI-like enzyme
MRDEAEHKADSRAVEIGTRRGRDAGGVNVRPATTADEPVLRELWEEFESELPAPPEDVETWEEEWQDVSADLNGRGAVYVAEDDEGVVGSARAKTIAAGVWYVVFAYVRPRGRRRGVLKALLRELVREGRERGSSRVTLDVLAVNEVGLAAWRRLGFQDDKHYLATTVDDLEERLGEVDTGPSAGAAYVQTDDSVAVERMVAKYLPRIGQSESTMVSQPENGWTRVDDELSSRDPQSLRRLSRELSSAMGAIVLTLGVEGGEVVRYILWDRGGIADEYVSLPEHHGPLPPGDVVALAANPTVAERLTGADPARVRAVARTGRSPEELPAADQHVAQIAEVLGVVWPG